MVHKLLITFTIEPEPIQSKIFSVNLKIKNLGETTYPGGVIETFRVRYVSYGDISQYVTKNIDVPELLVNDEWETSDDFLAYTEGVGWIDVQLSSSDEETVQYYQFEGGNIHDIWQMPFSIKNRESNEIIRLLEQILEKLEGLK